MIKRDGSVIYSQDGVRWYPYRNLAFKYLITIDEFNFYYDFNESPKNIEARNINGTVISLDWNYNSGNIQFLFPNNGIFIINFQAENDNIVLVIIKV